MGSTGRRCGSGTRPFRDIGIVRGPATEAYRARQAGLVLQLVRPVIRRWSSSGYDLIGSSSSPAGGSPVRVAARRPGSRLAARSGNGPGRSPVSKALQGGATGRSAASREVCSVVRGPAREGGSRGSRAAEITAKATDAVKILDRSRQGPSGVWGVERSDSDGGNWGRPSPGPPRPGDLRRLSPERHAL